MMRVQQLKKLWMFFIAVLLFVKTNGQSPVVTVLSSFHVNGDWKTSFVADTSNFPMFKRKQIGKWIFTYSKDKSQKVSFTIFKFSDSEAELFAEAIDKYMTLSSCQKSENQDLNFVSFVKNGFLFLLHMCPCNTKESLPCRSLAISLKKWTVE